MVGRLITFTRRVRARDNESGVSLIELLVTIALALVVIGLPMTFIIVSINQENVGVSRVAATNQAELGLQQLTRDLRNVSPSTTTTLTWSASAATVSLTLPYPGSGGANTESVSWTCGFSSQGTGTCSRAVTYSGSTTTVVEMKNVESIVFSPLDSSGNTLGGSGPSYTAANPAYVGITAQVLDVSQLDASRSHAVQGISHPITLQAGVDLLNNTI